MAKRLNITLFGEFNTKILKISADLSKIDYGEYTESVVINVGQSSLSIPVQISYYRPSYIEIISPEAGKVYTMGTVLPIKWNSNVGGTVKIELVRNGSVQQSIISSVDNYSTGNHSWGIPSLSVDAYQIRITSNETPSVYGMSEIFYLEDGPTPPVVSTGEVSSITSSSITVYGAIEDLGKTYSSVTQYGHVYSEVNPNPTVSDYKYNHGSSNQTMSYSSELVNLKPNTRYYVRAYAENPKGIAYGATVSVTTKTVDGKDPWEPTAPDENGAVDLGLSVKWAAYNVGATKPEEYGNYYAWGEVETKIDYTEGNYKFSKADSYIIGFLYKGSVYAIEIDEIAPRFMKVEHESSKKGGCAKLQLRLNNVYKEQLIRKGAYMLGSASLLEGEYNKGVEFERYITEMNGQTFRGKDNVGFWVAGDIEIEGKQVQVKFDGAQIVVERTLIRLKKENRASK